MKTNIHTPEPQVSSLNGEISLLNPDPAMIRIEDIITALGHQVRYGGHTTKPVTILQHSVHVWLMTWDDGLSYELQRQALWHDAAEAYVLDIPRPLKHLLGDAYAMLERRFEWAIGEALGVDLLGSPSSIHVYDTYALAAECALWRPKVSYAAWEGLPDYPEDYEGLAHTARKIASTPGAVLALDLALRAEEWRPVHDIVATARGL